MSGSLSPNKYNRNDLMSFKSCLNAHLRIKGSVRSLVCILLTVLLLSGITTSMPTNKMSNFCTCDATSAFTYVIVNALMSNDIKTYSHSE